MSITLDGVSSLPSTDAAYSPSGGSEVGKDAFLTLLVTQLQNQDPLNPQSNEEFVAQLAQFSSLEQLVSMNEGVDSLYMATASMNNATMTQLLGSKVVAWSDEFFYDGSDGVELHFDSDGAADSATLTISDEDGDVVWSGSIGNLEDGEGSWEWDGTNVDGAEMGEGIYSFDIDATSSGDTEVEVFGQVHGEVDGMSYEEGSPIPSINDVQFTLGDILRVETPEEGEN